MPVVFTSGDLLSADGLAAYAHGCNCAGAMGRGIAVAFRERWPRMYEEYRTKCAAGEFRLGDVFVWRERGETVFNLGTQRTWRTKADLPAIERAVRSMVTIAQAEAIDRIGLPRIGAGLGGLPWESVRNVIERVGASTPVELVVFETFVPTDTVETP